MEEDNIQILEARRMKTKDKTRCATYKKLGQNVFY